MTPWRPTADHAMLVRRASLLATIRAFFAVRGVLEVETPLLAAHGVTDVHIRNFEVEVDGERYRLQTSPEYAMKRLLAAGSGPIFQLGKAFRADERGRCHAPEFTMLEWYRPGFDHHALMDEMDALLSTAAGLPSARRTSYRQLFRDAIDLDPHMATVGDLRSAAEDAGIALRDETAASLDRDAWLELIMSQVIEPTLGQPEPTFVFDYPASQAALARLAQRDDVTVAERFEVYIAGYEIANGFHELADAAEQRRRFEADLAARAEAGLTLPSIDERLLAALGDGGTGPGSTGPGGTGLGDTGPGGIGDCAGVALGVDRLLMAIAEADHIDEVIAFPIERA